MKVMKSDNSFRKSSCEKDRRQEQGMKLEVIFVVFKMGKSLVYV